MALPGTNIAAEGLFLHYRRYNVNTMEHSRINSESNCGAKNQNCIGSQDSQRFPPLSDSISLCTCPQDIATEAKVVVDSCNPLFHIPIAAISMHLMPIQKQCYHVTVIGISASLSKTNLNLNLSGVSTDAKQIKQVGRQTDHIRSLAGHGHSLWNNQ